MEAWQFIERFAPCATIAHHIPGRVRLKFDGGSIAAAELREIHPERLRVSLEGVRGVFSVRLNMLARSCTVEYDETVIPGEAWEDLLACRMTAAADILAAILREGHEKAGGGTK